MWIFPVNVCIDVDFTHHDCRSFFRTPKKWCCTVFPGWYIVGCLKFLAPPGVPHLSTFFLGALRFLRMAPKWWRIAKWWTAVAPCALDQMDHQLLEETNLPSPIWSIRVYVNLLEGSSSSKTMKNPKNPQRLKETLGICWDQHVRYQGPWSTSPSIRG